MQLSFVVFCYLFVKGICQRCWWVGNGSFDVGGVFGQYYEVQINYFFMCKVVEISVNESVGNFVCVVSVEVYENQCVVVFYCCISLVFGVDNGCFDKFIVFIMSVSGLQVSYSGICLEFVLGQGYQIICFFYVILMVVVVYSVVMIDDRCYVVFVLCGEFVFEFFQ